MTTHGFGWNRPTALAITCVLALSYCASSPSPRSDGTHGHFPEPAQARRDPPGEIKHVLFVSIDGLLPEVYLHPEHHGLHVPKLRWLVDHGASSDGALSVFPSLTYPSHTTLATGVVPGKHGIVANATFDPLGKDLDGWRWYAEDIKRDPIWRIASRAGYRVGLVQWPVTVGADVAWLVPEYWRAGDANDQKLLRTLATPGLLESVAETHPDFWKRYTPPEVMDDALTDIAIEILARGHANLLQLHLVQVDAAQHQFGVWSPEAIAAIEKDDHQIARLLEALSANGLASDTSVVVASDHGFMNASKMVRPGVLLRDAGLVKLDAQGHVVSWRATLIANSGQAYVYLHDPKDAAARDAVRALLSAKLSDPESGLARLYEPAEIVSFGGDPEAILAIEATADYQFGDGFAGDYVAPPTYKATHGYDPRRPEMRASLLLYGPNVPHGTIPGARLVDVAPTIASWLALPMPNVDGVPLKVAPGESL